MPSDVIVSGGRVTPVFPLDAVLNKRLFAGCLAVAGKARIDMVPISESVQVRDFRTAALLGRAPADDAQVQGGRVLALRNNWLTTYSLQGKRLARRRLAHESIRWQSLDPMGEYVLGNRLDPDDGDYFRIFVRRTSKGRRAIDTGLRVDFGSVFTTPTVKSLPDGKVLCVQEMWTQAFQAFYCLDGRPRPMSPGKYVLDSMVRGGQIHMLATDERFKGRFYGRGTASGIQWTPVVDDAYAFAHSYPDGLRLLAGSAGKWRLLRL